MLQDLEKGKRCEIDAINGVISVYGRKVNVPTPFNDKVVEIIKKIEEGIRRPSWDNLPMFDDLISGKKK
jgi:2-dehydropantoate 2-reductase